MSAETATTIPERRRGRAGQTVVVTPTIKKKAKRKRALAVLAEASQRVLTRERTTADYADQVEAIIQCREAGCRLSEITKTITGGKEEYRGRASRQVMLARWTTGEWSVKRGEVPLKKSVEVSGKAFKTPLEALRANTTTYTQVFNTFIAAIRPGHPRATTTPTTPQEGVKHLLSRAITIKSNGGKPKRMKVTEDPKALLMAIFMLLEEPVAKDVLSERRCSAWVRVIQDVAREQRWARAMQEVVREQKAAQEQKELVESKG